MIKKIYCKSYSGNLPKNCTCGGKIIWGSSKRKGKLIGQCDTCKAWIFLKLVPDTIMKKIKRFFKYE